MAPKVEMRRGALEEEMVAEPVMEVPVTSLVVFTSTSSVVEAPAAMFPMEQDSDPGPEDEQVVPAAAMPARLKDSAGPPSLTWTVAVTLVAVTFEVFETVVAHPPFVPALTRLWSGGVVGGTWTLGLVVAGSTVVEAMAAALPGAVQLIWRMEVPRDVTELVTMTMFPGTKSTGPVPGPVFQDTGL